MIWFIVVLCDGCGCVVLICFVIILICLSRKMICLSGKCLLMC